jgi:hypothetical protein
VLPVSGADFTYTLAFKVTQNPANTGGNTGSGDVDVISHLIRPTFGANTHYFGAFGSGIFGSRGLYFECKNSGGGDVLTFIIDTNTVLNEWLACAYTRNGTTGDTHFYIARLSAPTSYLMTHSVGTSSVPGGDNPEHALLYAIDDALPAAAHIRLGGLKMWAAELTESEVQTEWGQRAPVKASPYLYLPLSVVTGTGQSDAGLDASGNGRHYTVTQTLSANADDPWASSGTLFDADAGTDTPTLSDSATIFRTRLFNADAGTDTPVLTDSITAVRTKLFNAVAGRYLFID